MGGSFTAVADGPTDAANNPAALIQVESIAISAGAHHLSLDAPPPFLVRLERSSSGSITGLSHIGYAHRIGGVVVAVLGTRPVDLRTSWSGGRGLGASRDLDLRLERVHVAAATNLGRHVSVGVAVAPSRFRVEASTSVFDSFTRAMGSDSDVGFTVGVIARPTAEWSLGLSFQESGEYEIRQLRHFGEDFTQDGIHDLPRRASAGVAWRPTGRFLVTTDAVRWRDSDLHSTFEDRTEIRFGMELRLNESATRPTHLRVGFAGGDALDGSAAVVPGDWLYSIGAGFGLRRGLLLDVGAGFGEHQTEAALSVSYRFDP